MLSAGVVQRIRRWLRSIGQPHDAEGGDGGVGSSERPLRRRDDGAVAMLSFFTGRSQTPAMDSVISDLPDEIWTGHILASLDPKSICLFSRTCRNGHRLANDDHLWQFVCEQHHIEKLPGSTWKFSFINWDSWTALHGTWDLLWGGKKNRAVFSFAQLCSAQRACTTAIGAVVRNIRAHIVCGRSVLSFEMHHSSTQRVFTYVVERMTRRDIDRSVAKAAALRFDRGLARDVFAVQVLRHKDANWYSGYLVRHSEVDNAALTADGLDKRYCAHVDLRACFALPVASSAS